MVRLAKEKDLGRINELRKQVNDIHVEGRPDIFKAGFGVELRDYAYTLMNGENSDIIVAERNGEICGMACVDYVHRPETAYGKARSFYHVQEIAVDENYRRQGVAKELLIPSAKSSEKCNKKYLQSIMCQKERSCIMQNTLAYNVKTSIAGVLV